MLTGMMWMAVGIAIVAWLPYLPPPPLLLAGLAACGMLAGWLWCCRHRSRRAVLRSAGIALIAAVAGLCWGCAYGYHIRSGLLPLESEQQSLLLRGRIDGLVEQREGFVRHGQSEQPVLHFQFAVEANAGNAALVQAAQFPRLLQLNWYDADKLPRAGERWQLRVKLKRPRGFANPGGFDYAAWLVANRIGATGYVERSGDNQILTAAPWYSLDAWRGRAQNYLQQRLQSFSHRDLLLGLLIGDGGAIAAAAWDTFRATGTVHLFVVSGLQIAFTGGLALWLARLWWRSPWCVSRRRNYVLGVIPAVLIAASYAVLAGWGVPIQRALIMFAVLVWALLARRRLRAATSWIAALWLVLLFDPLAVRAIGFWFSFVAVAAILLIICGHRDVVVSPVLQSGLRWWRVQWALFATSVPLLLLLSGQLTLLALPANVIAIPLSTFIALPLAFVALLADFFAPAWGAVIWHWADTSLDWLWRYLLWLQQSGSWAVWHPRAIDAWVCAFAACAALLLLLPRNVPGRAFAPIFLVPLLAPPQLNIAPGDCVVTVIDVGQGLSVLVETAQHRLLYDTGPQLGPERTVADLTVVPVLRQRGVDALDTVVLSHDDSDHAGGWPAVAREFNVQRLLLGEALANPVPLPTALCRADMHWRWDGVDFAVLYPVQDGGVDKQLAGNNRSCVLQIDASGACILLPGDIERAAEYKLLDNSALQSAALLLAPHHGSRSSSTPSFVERVRPEYVVFSSGYLNRFRHPHADVAARYRQSGATLFDTAFAGAVTFTFSQGHVAQIAEQRTQLRHYWD